MASLVLPVIDYPTLHARKSDGTRTAESLQERRELWAALSGSGFAYLRSPGVSQETVEALFENSKKFFSKSFEEKLKIKGQLDKGRGPSQGYSNPAKLAVNPKTSDLKEFFGMYRDDDTESPNQWLPDADSQKMRADLVVFFESCHSVILELLSALTEEVGLPADTLHPYVSEKNHFIANLKYPEAQKNDFENRVRAAAHTDYGCLTLLFNDAGEGLQVKRLNHDWEYVKRKDGCAILNVGDLTSRFFNGLLPSTVHRVIEPPSLAQGLESSVGDRYSIPFFGHYNLTTMVKPLPSLVTADRPAQFEPVEAGEHVKARVRQLHLAGHSLKENEGESLKPANAAVAASA